MCALRRVHFFNSMNSLRTRFARIPMDLFRARIIWHLTAGNSQQCWAVARYPQMHAFCWSPFEVCRMTALPYLNRKSGKMLCLSAHWERQQHIHAIFRLSFPADSTSCVRFWRFLIRLLQKFVFKYDPLVFDANFVYAQFFRSFFNLLQIHARFFFFRCHANEPPNKKKYNKLRSGMCWFSLSCFSMRLSMPLMPIYITC